MLLNVNCLFYNFVKSLLCDELGKYRLLGMKYIV